MGMRPARASRPRNGGHGPACVHDHGRDQAPEHPWQPIPWKPSRAVPKSDLRKGTRIRAVGSNAGGLAEGAERCRRRLVSKRKDEPTGSMPSCARNRSLKRVVSPGSWLGCRVTLRRVVLATVAVRRELH